MTDAGKQISPFAEDCLPVKQRTTCLPVKQTTVLIYTPGVMERLQIV